MFSTNPSQEAGAAAALAMAIDAYRLTDSLRYKRKETKTLAKQSMRVLGKSSALI